MSWFKRGIDRKSPEGSASSRAETDPNTCLEVFQNHWKQACIVIGCQDKKATLSNGQATADGVETVLSNLEHMVTLLVNEDDDGGLPGPILQCVLESDLLENFCAWCTINVPVHERLRLQQLKLFELIISQSKQLLLVHKPVIKPLLRLLLDVADSQEMNNGELEFKLVLVLHQICICISQQSLILESFFSTDTDHGPARFLIFSLLIPYIHREGPVGQRARDALLLIMTLSARHPHIGQYIANNSDFCPVLATGLSGLYSSLPRRITPPSDEWYAITREDCVRIPDLQMFLNSLQFSNAVVQIAHPLVRDQLIHFIYSGFLVPVLAPALHQDIPGLPIPLLDTDLFRISREEVMTATAYLDLFIRHVTDPHLLKATLKFFLTEKYDDVLILESLLPRINSNSHLSSVTLSLFHTLVNLNCEDVMFQLIFRYLVPCTHVMVSQRLSIRDLDLYGKSAEKFLSLRPSCCIQSLLPNPPPSITPTPLPHLVSMSTPSQRSTSVNSPPPNFGHHSSPQPPPEQTSGQQHGESSYFEYLHDARNKIEQTACACQHWTFVYDGESPPPDSIKTADKSAASSSQQVIAGKDVEAKPKTGFIELGSIHASDVEGGRASIERTGQGLVGTTGESAKENDLLPVEKCNLVKGENEKSLNPKLYASLESMDSFIDYLSDIEDSGEGSASMEDSLISLEVALESVVAGQPSKNVKRDTKPTSSESKHAGPGAAGKSEIPVNILSPTVPTDVASAGPTASNSNSVSGLVARGDNCNELITTTKPEAVPPVVKKERIVPKDLPKSLKSNNMNPLYLMSTKQLLSPGDAVSPFRLNFSANDEFFAMVPNSSAPRKQLKYSNESPNIGPFLGFLLSRLEGMLGNSLYFNLLLTDVLARLAAYPQPLLRSFLLNHNLVFQPSVKSLIQVLSSLRQKLESFSVTVKQFNVMVSMARQNLALREEQVFQSFEHGVLGTPTNIPIPVQPVRTRAETVTAAPASKEKRKVNLSELFFRRTPSKDKLALGANKNLAHLHRLQVGGDGGYRYISGQDPADSNHRPVESMGHSLSTWNAVYCALILDEFLKELAALSQEHSLLHLDEGYLSG